MTEAHLWYWIRERENIRLARAAGKPWPWSADRIFQTSPFCNVRREDDKVTLWIREHIREPYANDKSLWLMLCIARMINWPATLQRLILVAEDSAVYGNHSSWPIAGKFSPGILGEELRRLMGAGEAVYGPAYIIPPSPVKGRAKSEHLVDLFRTLWHSRGAFEAMFAGRPTMQDVHNRLKAFLGWGDFLAYQAVVDMRFTRLLQNAPDVHLWAAAGPGTIKGLNRLHGRKTEAHLRQDRALREMSAIYPNILKLTGVLVDFSDVPNIFCEYDKYMRYLSGEGKPKRNYAPPTGQGGIF